MFTSARHDQLLNLDERPRPGAHLVTPRVGFMHHGICVGPDRVVHYRAIAYVVPGKPVEEVSLAEFAQGRRIWVRHHAECSFDADVIIRRARSRVGESRYRLLSNNCEHFCEWCLHDASRSYQVDRALAVPRRLTRLLRATTAQPMF